MRLLALGRPACFSLCCAALSLSLVRYCCSVRPAVRVTCLSLPGTMPMFSHLVISSYRRAVPSCVSCLLRCVSPLSSHLTGHRLARLLPVLRHGWAGREAGRRRCPACLVFALRSVPMSADVDSWLIPFPSSAVSSLGLLALSARLRWRWCSLVRAGCVAMFCLPLICSSRLSSRCIVSSVGSVLRLSRPVLRHDRRGGGRIRCCCGVLSFLVLISCRLASFPVLACLGPFLAIHLIRMAAEVCGSVGSAGGLFALPHCIRAASRRSVVPFHGSFDWCGSVPSP